LGRDAKVNRHKGETIFEIFVKSTSVLSIKGTGTLYLILYYLGLIKKIRKIMRFRFLRNLEC